MTVFEQTLLGNKFWPFEAKASLIVCMSGQLKDDAVALVDVLAPTDFILNSPIANADGEVKKPNLHRSFAGKTEVLK